MNEYQVILNQGVNIVKVKADSAYCNSQRILCFTVEQGDKNTLVAQFNTWDGWNVLAPPEDVITNVPAYYDEVTIGPAGKLAK
jgi:hypothetical protein